MELQFSQEKMHAEAEYTKLKNEAMLFKEAAEREIAQKN